MVNGLELNQASAAGAPAVAWVMDQNGHEDSRMSVEVHARASKRKRVDRSLSILDAIDSHICRPP